LKTIFALGVNEVDSLVFEVVPNREPHRSVLAATLFGLPGIMPEDSEV
jgi:hypothetical protein